MFTGIIKELGRVSGISNKAGVAKVSVKAANIFKYTGLGDSIAVNGACLTIVEKKEDILTFDVTEETASRTNLKNLKLGDIVNMEGALRTGEPLSGHFVLGHVDCVGRIKSLKPGAGGLAIWIEIPDKFSHLVVEKGSIAVDGISLTVGETRKDLFDVNIIPHTLKATTLASRKAGDEVNIEFDIIGKHIARLRVTQAGSRITEKFLQEKGF